MLFPVIAKIIPHVTLLDKWQAGLQCSVGHFDPLWTFFPVNGRQIFLTILVFLTGHFMFIEPCRTKYATMSAPSARHQHLIILTHSDLL